MKLPFIAERRSTSTSACSTSTPPHEEVIVSDQKRLVVDAFTRYRIIDPLLFYQTVGNRGRHARPARARSSPAACAACSAASRCSTSCRRSAPRSCAQIRDESPPRRKPFGIEVVDVRIKRADLPDENSQAIFRRMQSEREREARQYRGEGAEAAQRVRANADRERTVLLAEAQREAQRVRGQGDAEAISIFAEAFGQDPQFFDFYRSLQAYRDALTGRTPRSCCRPDSDFFRFFDGWPGRRDASAGAAPLAAGAARRRPCRRRA